ncbi:hypothetical protein ACFSKU_19255 [Pontibacter silvestris]|uniref:Uncharacterized protein n=1 Tax=Pontibacter silvestris TaxID=2305183 RepID=A0ABW4X227_9BACT|nr:hypothetical protein [Pontibacter silvestris]
MRNSEISNNGNYVMFTVNPQQGDGDGFGLLNQMWQAKQRNK